MSASISTKFDYCNDMYFGISQISLPPLQLVQNASAGLLEQVSKSTSPLYYHPCTASRYVLESILKITLSS